MSKGSRKSLGERLGFEPKEDEGISDLPGTSMTAIAPLQNGSLLGVDDADLDTILRQYANKEALYPWLNVIQDCRRILGEDGVLKEVFDKSGALLPFLELRGILSEFSLIMKRGTSSLESVIKADDPTTMQNLVSRLQYASLLSRSSEQALLRLPKGAQFLDYFGSNQEQFIIPDMDRNLNLLMRKIEAGESGGERGAQIGMLTQYLQTFFRQLTEDLKDVSINDLLDTAMVFSAIEKALKSEQLKAAMAIGNAQGYIKKTDNLGQKQLGRILKAYEIPKRIAIANQHIDYLSDTFNEAEKRVGSQYLSYVDSILKPLSPRVLLLLFGGDQDKVKQAIVDGLPPRDYILARYIKTRLEEMESQ